MNEFNRILILLLFFVAVGCNKIRERADVVILGGKIYTVNDEQPIVRSVAVKGDKILFAGSEKEGRAYISDGTRIIDLQGKVMTPGFIEGHGHIMGIGYNELELNLMSAKSYE